MKRNLDRMFGPESIAVVGGGVWCESVIRENQKIGFGGAIWPVHPKHDRISGLPAFRSLADLPGPPDACFVGVNKYATIEIVEQLQSIGAGGAVCFANGFQEAAQETEDGQDLQMALLAAAKNMPLIGPNCYGFVNYLDRAMLWPDQHGGRHVDRGVAIIAQSSNIAINLTMQDRGLPIAFIATVGNQAQIGIADIGATLLMDDRVSVLGLHIEGFDDLRRLEDLARTARTLGKHIVALKTGRSHQARSATMSHTASLAGSHVGASALLRRLGIAQVDTLPEFVDLLNLLHCAGPLGSNAVTSMSCSGGEACLMADVATEHDIEFPPLSAHQCAKLAHILGPAVKLANPLDYNTHIWSDTQAMTDTFSAMMAERPGIGLVVLDFPRSDRCDPSEWDKVVTAIQATQLETRSPMGVVATLGENMPETAASRMVAAGITPFTGMSEAFCAIERAAALGRGVADAQQILLPLAPNNPMPFDERVAKSKLAGFGVRIPQNLGAATADQAAKAADQIGYPVVLKGADIAHKTEVGAVVTGLRSAKAVRQAAQDMDAKQYLVEQMISDCVAELLVGVVLDPAHGYVLTLGAGGVLAELIADSASLLIPSSQDAVRACLGSIRLSKLLQGYRGQPAANIDAVVDTIMSVQAFVIANQGWLESVEINPLMCGTKNAVAVDALLVAGEKDD